MRQINENKAKEKVLSIALIFTLGIIVVQAYGLFSMNGRIQALGLPVEVPEKSMPLFFMSSWGNTYENPNEVLFTGWVYNLGLVEAKGLVLECVVTREGVEVYTTNHTIGNIGSKSSKLVQVKRNFYVSDNDEAICHVVSCEDDCLNLKDRIDVN